MPNTPETTPEAHPLDALSYSQFEHWRATGEMPKQEDAPAPADGTDKAADTKPAAAEDVAPRAAEESEESAETPDEKQDDKADDEAAKKPARKGGYQRKIERLTAERDALARQLEDVNSRLAPPRAADGTAQPAEQEPKQDDFSDYAEYVRAVARYEAKQSRTEHLKQEAERIQRETNAKRGQVWQERLADARTRYSDFDQALQADVRVSPAMQDILLDSEAGADLAYWLGKNPADATRIAQLSPLQAAKELGRIEARISAAPAPAAPKTQTSAPPPPSTVKGAKTPAAGQSVYDDNLSYRDWERLRNEQLSRKKR